MAATTVSSVLLLSWDNANDVLPLANALPPGVEARLWTAAPLSAGAAPRTAVQVLRAPLPDAPDLALRRRAAPEFPYVGASAPAQAAPPAPFAGAEQRYAPVSATGQAYAGEPDVAEAADLSGGRPAASAAAEGIAEALAPETGSAKKEESPAAEAETQEPIPAAPEPDLNYRIIQYARHAVRLAPQASFEVIFAPDWPTWLAGVELSLLTRRPLVLRVSQLAADRPALAERGWAEALERLALPHAQRVLVPDEATGQRLCAQYRLASEVVHVISPGAEPSFTAALVLDARLPL